MIFPFSLLVGSGRGQRPGVSSKGSTVWIETRFDESIQESKRALELDPLSINYNTALAFIFFLARRYDQATEQAAKILELDPKFIPAYYVRGVAYVQKSMHSLRGLH